MTNIAMYPGTFDPITNGHLDIITRADRIFDKVLIAVAASSRKTPLFQVDIRMEMIKALFVDSPQIEVLELQGLLVDFARQQRANIILRGLRAVSDFDYEFQMAGMNRHMAAELETVFLPASEHYSYISATMVREIVDLGGDVADFVPRIVLQYLK